jgi:hypothetical protein
MARAIVIQESLKDGKLPAVLCDCAMRTYTHHLDGQQAVQIIEVELDEDSAPDTSLQLALALVPRRYYAHVWTPSLLYVCFPSVVALIAKGDMDAEGRAQEIGGLFDIPVSQMRFAEMFTMDHPDLEK